MFSSIAGRLAQAGLCTVVLQDGWPRLDLCSVLLNDGGWPSQALRVLAVIMNGWLIFVFSSIVGRMA